MEGAMKNRWLYSPAVDLTALVLVTLTALVPYALSAHFGWSWKYIVVLVGLFNGNVELALTAYNRGEDKVYAEYKAGLNPRNGYDKAVLGTYKGKGIIQQGRAKER